MAAIVLRVSLSWTAKFIKEWEPIIKGLDRVYWLVNNGIFIMNSE